MTPQDRVVQVRVPDYKNLLPKDSEAYRKTSFHDDFIVVDPHRWDGNMHEGTPNFDQIVEEGAFMPVDGELPWGTWSMNKENGDANGWIIDGKKTARQLFLEHYTSLSVIHNYKERGAPDKYSMMYWKETPISEEYLKEKHMPVSDGYFRNTTAVLPKETHSNMCAIIWDTVSNCKNCKSTHSSIRITISSTFRSH